MSKLAFFCVTLIAAIPAAYLGYLAVMGFLSHSGDMSPVLMGVTGLTLLMCAIAVAMPVAALLRRGPRTEEPESETNDAAPADEFGEDDEIVEETGEEEDAEVYAEDVDDENMDFDAFEDEDQKR